MLIGRQLALITALAVAAITASPQDALAQTQNWNKPQVRDVLDCRSSQIIKLKNAEGEIFETDRLQVAQNDNRNYATVVVNGKKAGLASYGRSKGAQIVSLMGWDMKIALRLKSNGSNVYSGRMNDDHTAIHCALGRRLLETH